MMKHATISFFLIAIIFSISTKSAAQENLQTVSGINIRKNFNPNKFDIDFSAKNEISNLLVIVSDSLGRTIFLDNQYRFRGNYNRSVDLSNEKKGDYTLKVIRDHEKIETKLSVK